MAIDNRASVDLGAVGSAFRRLPTPEPRADAWNLRHALELRATPDPSVIFDAILATADDPTEPMSSANAMLLTGVGTRDSERQHPER